MKKNEEMLQNQSRFCTIKECDIFHHNHFLVTEFHFEVSEVEERETLLSKGKVKPQSFLKLFSIKFVLFH